MERAGGEDQSSFDQTLRQAQGERCRCDRPIPPGPLTLTLSRMGRGDFREVGFNPPYEFTG